MRVIGRPHDAIGADDIQIPYAEGVALEGGVAVVVPVVTGTVVDAVEDVAVDVAVEDHLRILKCWRNPRNAALGEHDFEVGMPVEHAAEQDLSKRFSERSK